MHDIWKQSRPSQRQSSGNESSSLAEGDKASDEESEASSLDDSSSGSFTDSEDDDRLTASEEDVVDNAGMNNDAVKNRTTYINMYIYRRIGRKAGLDGIATSSKASKGRRNGHSKTPGHFGSRTTAPSEAYKE